MIVYLFVAALFILMFLVEHRLAARQFDSPAHWCLRAILFNSVQIVLTLMSGVIWDKWLQKVSIINGQEILGSTSGVILGYLIITFVFYWWHRLRHEVDFFWTKIHQLHHSPRRIEVLTAFYKHPLEILLDSLLTSTLLYTILGLDPITATITISVTGVAELIYHWNIKTPYWLGFIFQRPESHLIHHQEGWHRNNYSDLPIWDMLFGTFQNPKIVSGKCGFKDNRELRVLEMLRGVDVNPRGKA